jgi:hypothetical protein
MLDFSQLEGLWRANENGCSQLERPEKRNRSSEIGIKCKQDYAWYAAINPT